MPDWAKMIAMILGFLLLSAGAWLLHPSAGLITAGILCLATDTDKYRSQR